MRSKVTGFLSLVAAYSLAGGPAMGQETSPRPKPPAATASGLRTGPATVEAHWSKNKYPDSIPDGATYYIVEKGDTLWDIAAKFLGNAYLWPQIWDQNRYIADAHWIYPGDPLILPKIALVSERAGEIPGLPDERGEGLPGETPGIGPGTVLVPVTEEVTLQCAQTILPGREDESLHVIGSEEGSAKIAFAERDILYLSRGSNAGVKAGDVYSLHHAAYTVRHPSNGRAIGTKVETTGWARVILVQENSATVVVEQACIDIHAGDYLKPFEKLNVPLIVRHTPPDRLTPPTGKVRGYVIDMSDDASIAGAGSVVSLDLGSEDGLTPGATLTAYRIMYPSVPTSRNVLGELAVMTVRERTATAKVIYSRDHIMNGDEVELR